MRICEFLVLPVVALFFLLVTGCVRDDAKAFFKEDLDNLSVSIAIRKDGLECRLQSLLLIYSASGVLPLTEPSPTCPDGGEVHGFAALNRDAAIRFVSVAVEHGVLSNARKLYSNRSGSPRSTPPADTSPFEGGLFSSRTNGFEISFTTHDDDWYTTHISFVQMDAEGQSFAMRLIDSLDGEARELMIQLMEPMDLASK